MASEEPRFLLRICGKDLAADDRAYVVLWSSKPTRSADPESMRESMGFNWHRRTSGLDGIQSNVRGISLWLARVDAIAVIAFIHTIVLVSSTLRVCQAMLPRECVIYSCHSTRVLPITFPLSPMAGNAGLQGPTPALTEY